MNLGRVDQIAKALLYEGYMLYPYRPSSVKNRQRFNFGVLYPRPYSEAQRGTDPYCLRTECLVRGNTDTQIEVRLRFLHLQSHQSFDPSHEHAWQEAIEREVCVLTGIEKLSGETHREDFTFAADTMVVHQERIHGSLDISSQRLCENIFKLSVTVQNRTDATEHGSSRDEALSRSLVSAHLVLGLTEGEFVSLLDPPAELQSLASQCKNIGVWPVLVGDSERRDTMLASPIILYDYPQIAPESAGDLFDGTEIDEILSLRIMTLTDDEKREIRESDERARLILERTESMPPEQFMKLHGALRGLRPVPEETP